MTYDIYDLQFVVHLELEGEVAMVIGVDPAPLLHTHISSTAKGTNTVTKKGEGRELEPSLHSVSRILSPNKTLTTSIYASLLSLLSQQLDTVFHTLVYNSTQVQFSCFRGLISLSTVVLSIYLFSPYFT